jgi:Tol biopolymer transport system component
MVRSGNLDVWVRDNVTGRSSALVVTPERNEFRALLSPDGSTVAFIRGPYGNAELYVVPFEGGSEEELADGVATIISWSADSKRVLYATKGVATWNTIDVSTGEIVRVLDNPGNYIHSPKLSPDGKWLLMKTLEGAETGAGAFIAPIRNGEAGPRSDWIQVAESRGGNSGSWSPDGNLVYFVASHEGSECLWARRLNPDSKQPLGEAFDVFHMHEDRRTVSWPVIGLSSDRLYLGVRESKANIWLAEPR